MTQRKEEIEKGINKAQQRILELKNYLAETDYQAIRQSEGGAAMSEEVKNNRTAARAEINELQESIAADVAILEECEDEPAMHDEELVR